MATPIKEKPRKYKLFREGTDGLANMIKKANEWAATQEWTTFFSTFVMVPKEKDKGYGYERGIMISYNPK